MPSQCGPAGAYTTPKSWCCAAPAASGTGRQMVPVAEMAAFAERFGFRFQAHERGDANRSGRVEGPFSSRMLPAGHTFQPFCRIGFRSGWVNTGVMPAANERARHLSI